MKAWRTRRVLVALVATIAMAVAGSAMADQPKPGDYSKAAAGTSYFVSPLDVGSAELTPGGFSYEILLP